MKAVRIHSYGGVEVLTIDQIAIPTPAENEVLIKVKATSVNPIDWKIREGYLKSMILHHLPLTLGWDVSGIIDSVGVNVTRFKPGDAVYSRPAIDRNGTYAEYVVVSESEVAFKPQQITHLHAATLPLVGVTAWEALINRAQIVSGSKVLIHGASGGVGVIAVQLAKYFGCYVYATTSTSNVQFVKRLGADAVIDYKKDDFSDLLQGIDVVFDTVGGDVQERSWQVLRRNGILVSIASPPSEERARHYGVRSAFVFSIPDAGILEELARLVDSYALITPVGYIFDLDHIADAHILSQSGRAVGKIAIKVSDN